MPEARANKEALRGEDLVAQVEELITKTGRISEEAERSGDQKTALSAIRESRGNIELLGKLHGQIQAAQITVNAQAQAAVVNGPDPAHNSVAQAANDFTQIIVEVGERALARKMHREGFPDWHKVLEGGRVEEIGN